MTPAGTAYASSDGAHVAYRVLGQGDVTFVMPSYGTISFEAFERQPHFARFLESISSFARLVLYDVRGVGLSDSISERPRTLDEQADDTVAVLDAIGAERAVVFAQFTAGPWGINLAASRPDRVQALVLCNTAACFLRKSDYEWGNSAEQTTGPGSAGHEGRDASPEIDWAGLHALSLTGDRRFRDWWEQEGRRGASPGAAALVHSIALNADVRPLLQQVAVPTLVIHRSATRWFVVAHGRYMAERIPGARFVELEGRDQFPFAENGTVLIEEVEEFVTGVRRFRGSERVLMTLLFTDIVDSTGHASAKGDTEWKSLLDAHDSLVRGELDRFGGIEVNTTGDGFLATFGSPANAVRCATAIRDRSEALGIQVRAGVHLGEAERRGQDIAGVAVHIARRVCDEADANEVLVSMAIPPVVVGSELAFEDRGERVLKGVSGIWRLYAAKD
jgi:class 3 adenylate cyclase